MFRAHSIGIEWGLLTLVVVLPIVCWRMRNRPATEMLLWLALATYLVVLLSLTLLPIPLRRDPALSPPLGYPWFNLQPFSTINRALRLGLGSYSGLILIGNLLIFVPVGILVPLLRRLRRPWLGVLLAAVGLSAAIEIGQLAASLALGVPYRQADVDDVMVNGCGGLLGYAVLVTMRQLRARYSAVFGKRE